jgi:glycosyltransferase involved in cell wall biosynthesis
MIKVINILAHTPQEIIYQYNDPDEYKKCFPETEYLRVQEKVKWVGFFKNDWHHKWGKYIKKLDSEIEMECWRPYGKVIKKNYTKDVDGIKHRVFPSSSLKIKKVATFHRSTEMLELLKYYMKEFSGKLIIHFYGSHNTLYSWLLNRLKPINTPIIMQHLGGWFGYFDYYVNKNPLKLIPYYFERKSFSYINKYLTSSEVEFGFLEEHFKKLDFELFLNGIDFYNISIIDKFKAKQKLNISPDLKMILYVGRLTDIKNVNFLIDAYNKIKNYRSDIVLYLVGGYKHEKFYKYAIESGAHVVERSDKPIDLYFSAADAYILPATDFFINNFGGIGIAVLEALAYNTMVVSKNLKHFSNDEALNEKLGISEFSELNLHEKIIELLDREIEYSVSDICKNYYNIEDNSKKIIQLYYNLLNNFK